MFRLFPWSPPLQPHHRPDALVVPTALRPLLDDCARRLARAPETPRRLQVLADYGVRALHGRFPG